MTDLAAAVLWPMVAIMLVLLGATFVTSGQSTSRPNQQRSPMNRSSTGGVDDRPRGGRRSTDRLPGDRMMVVIAGSDQGDTVRTALEAARRAGPGVTVIDPRAAGRGTARASAPDRLPLLGDDRWCRSGSAEIGNRDRMLRG